MRTVTVVFSSNDRFAMLLGVALCSLFENKKGDYPIDIYVIDSGISAKNKERLAVLEKKYGFTINYVLPDKEFFGQIPIDKLSKGYHLPMENYHRISVARFLPPTCRKVINLDVDVVVRGDIAELFNIDLDGKTIGAVADCYAEERMRHLKNLCESVHWPAVPGESACFNSGMLLIDLDLWRKRGIEKKLLVLIRGNSDKLLYHDQDALNVVLLGDCKELPAKYNLLTETADQQDERNPLIVHFVGGGKPWYFLSALPYRSEYIYYVNKTPWKNEKYRKLMDIYFAKKYYLYPVAWTIWSAYKKLKTILTHEK